MRLTCCFGPILGLLGCWLFLSFGGSLVQLVGEFPMQLGQGPKPPTVTALTVRMPHAAVASGS